MFPADPMVKALFNELGTATELDREEEFEAFTTATSIMSSYFCFGGTVAEWMRSKGVAGPTAHTFVTQMLQGLAGASAVKPTSSFDEMTEEHQTRGGLNEQVLRSLTEAGVFKELDRALDGVLTRLNSARHSQ